MACMDEPQKRLTVMPATEIGKSGQNDDQTRHIEALFAFGKGAAQDQVFDVMRVDAGFFDESLDNLRCEIVRSDFNEAAFMGGRKRRPAISSNNNVFHNPYLQ